MAQLRIGVIGCGGHSRRAILPSLRFAGFRLAAACDLDAAKAEAAARDFGADTVYTRYEQLLRKEELDVVAVIGPPALHMEAGVAALELGRHVFVEKPPGMTAEDAEVLARSARDRFVMVGFQKRHARAYRLVRDLSMTREFGRPSMLRMTYSHVHEPTLRDHVAFMSVHAIDLARSFMGRARAGSVHRADRNGHSAIGVMLEHDSGALSMLSLSALEPRLQETVEIAGESTLARVRDLAEVVYDRRAGDWNDCFNTDLRMASLWRPDLTIPIDANNSLVLQGYAGEMVELADAVRHGRRPDPDIHDALSTMRIVDALVEAPTGFSSFSLQ